MVEFRSPLKNCLSLPVGWALLFLIVDVACIAVSAYLRIRSFCIRRILALCKVYNSNGCVFCRVFGDFLLFFPGDGVFGARSARKTC